MASATNAGAPEHSVRAVIGSTVGARRAGNAEDLRADDMAGHTAATAERMAQWVTMRPNEL